MKRSAAPTNIRAKTPTYDEIRSFASRLQQDPTKVKECREIGQKLLSRVSNVDVRRKLAEEATLNARSMSNPDVSVASARCHALAQLWKIVISGAINFTERIKGGGKSKAKLNPKDILLPFRLLQACDSPDEAFDSVGLNIPKLSKPTVRKVLYYCLNMLADDDGAARDVEVDVLEMLNHLCSRTSHVESFSTKDDLHKVLSEIAIRLDISDDNGTGPSAFHVAARVFENLFASCISLGIEVHYLLDESIELVSSHFRRSIKSGEINMSDTYHHFYNVVTLLLNSHPEHAIGPMERKGKYILQFARRSFNTAAVSHRLALSKYFLAHM